MSSEENTSDVIVGGLRFRIERKGECVWAVVDHGQITKDEAENIREALRAALGMRPYHLGSTDEG